MTKIGLCARAARPSAQSQDAFTAAMEPSDEDAMRGDAWPVGVGGAKESVASGTVRGTNFAHHMHAALPTVRYNVLTIDAAAQRQCQSFAGP